MLQLANLDQVVPMTRLDPQSGEVIDRGQIISFQFEGRTFQGYRGDTIGSALSASGVEIFSRSFKYHRPRGLLCVSGKCPNCLMNVNGVPNVRVCTERLRPGDRVTSQHCWPSLRRDVFSLIEKFDFLLPVGFYYKTLIRPRFLWQLAQPLLRRLAGLGNLGDQREQSTDYSHEYLHTDLVVVGGGSAGMAAATAAADAGVEVVLIDDQPELGGELRVHRRHFPDPFSPQSKSGFEIVREMADRVIKHQRIKVFNPAAVIGGYEGGLLAIRKGNCLIHLRARETVVATGTYEVPWLFENNDLPGVMLGTGALRLIHLYGVKPGKQAAVVVGDDEGLEVAVDLSRAGVRVVAVIDGRPETSDSPAVQELKDLHIPYLSSFVPVAAQGRSKVRSLRVAPLTSEGGVDARQTRSFECDVVCLCSLRAPSADLLRQNQGTVTFDPALNQMVPDKVPDHFHAAGNLTGYRELSIHLLQGRLAGLEAASCVRPLEGFILEDFQRTAAQLKQEEERYRETVRSSSLFTGFTEGKQFVCLCEDVTRKDVGQAVAEGFDEMELLKRYTTASMGPCQGRMCLGSLGACCAKDTGRTPPQTGTTTSRPPIQTVSLGLLAGPEHFPVKLTPIHHKHAQVGVQWMDMGQWKRPHTYTHPELEWKAVRERVGLIDVSTLGKIDVRGRDAGRLLDKVYTHNFSTLKVGRVRYGVICGDDGIILDDGTVSHVADDYFYITTTTGNIDFVERWLNWWIIGTGLCTHVTNVTSDFAAVNLAGPKARDLLERLTELDVSAETFKYMQCAQADVAGVPTLLMRIGFVGETGWEIHYPSCYGEYLWEVLLAVGKEFGLLPFGVEAQRILRLEKKHVIVGQDTDALSNPLESDMEWVVRFNKDDFIGKPALAVAREQEFQNRLVGFVADELVEEGSSVVLNRQPVGRVTSARISPGQNRCVGMAWVPAGLSADGTKLEIQNDGKHFVATVHQPPFYDPDGVRLRE